MPPDRRIHLIAWAAAGALHLAVAGALLIDIAYGDPPAGGAWRQGRTSAISVSLVSPEASPTAAAPAASAPARPTLQTYGADSGRRSIRVDAPDRDDADAAAQGAGVARTQAASAEAPIVSVAALTSYRERLQDYVARYQRYPIEARRDRVQGVVYVHFVLNREGRISDGWIERSSGSTALDDEALAVIQRAEPLPQFPPGWPNPLDISLPIAFNLR